MAIRRTSSNSISNAVKLSTGFASAAIPNSPTIGTATATSDVAATVAYTAAVLGATGTTFTATSNPSSITGTGPSPITVTGLTASTSYTFTVTAGNANGTSAASSASNSITTSARLSFYESIATVTVGSGGQSTISFTSIPSTFTHLQIRGIARNTSYSGGGAEQAIKMQFNSDTGSNYTTHGLVGNGTSASSYFESGTNAIWWTYGVVPMTDASANIFGGHILDILDYKNTNKFKTSRFIGGVDTNGSTNSYSNFGSGNWRDTAAITSITLFPQAGSFAQFTSYALYGIKGV